MITNNIYKTEKFTKMCDLRDWLNKKIFIEIKLIQFDKEKQTLEVFYQLQ